MTKTREHKFGWVFMFIAGVVAVWAFEMVWWQALIVIILANIELTFTTTTNHRPKYRRDLGVY